VAASWPTFRTGPTPRPCCTPTSTTQWSKALTHAHRWKQLLDSGSYAAIHDLVETERIYPSCSARILRLTLLIPDVAKAILDGRQPAGLQLDGLLVLFPV
jgi:hypothetical protein